MTTNHDEKLLNAAQLKAARDWIKDCLPFRDLREPEEVDALSDTQVINDVKNNYAGGIEAFIAECGVSDRPLLRPSFVEIASLNGQYACYVEHGKKWDGQWVRPWFSWSQVIEVLNAFVQQTSLELIDLKPSQITINAESENDSIIKPVKMVQLDGAPLYPFCNGSFRWSEVGGSLNADWPLEIKNIDDLHALLVALHSEDRVFHFDDDPAGLIKEIFNETECSHLRKLINVDCAKLGGVWKMMEEEEGQRCHKLLGIGGPEDKPEPEMRLSVSRREFHTIMAALRCYETTLILSGRIPHEYHVIASNDGEVPPLKPKEVEELRVRLNTE